MHLYNFKSISVVPNAHEFCDIVLSKTQRKTPTVVHAHYKISRIRSFYTRKIKTVEQNIHDRLSKIIQDFPKIDCIHPFYSSLLNIYYDKDHYKLGLGQLNLARNIIHNIGKDYCRLLKFGDSLYRCKQLKKVAIGKMVTVIKKQKNNFEYLEQVRKHLSRLPSINPYTRTLIICGYPNVGKSSFLNKLTRADVDVQPYPFTTKSLYVGHMDYKYLRWQLIDTPGILDKKLEERNIIEMQSITALAYLHSVVLYFIDLSESCGQSVDEQISMFNNINILFNNKPIVIVLSKIDLLSKNELDRKFLHVNEIFQENNKMQKISFVMISTVDNVGIEQVKEIACESLLAYRIENKLKSNKCDRLLSKLHVAYPKVIDDTHKSHSNLKCANIIKKNITVIEHKLEREIELEMGDDYFLDLRKNYDIPENYKYDIIPEIWEGHNIMDFIQPDLFKKLEDLENEEVDRENSGFYRVPKIELDDEMNAIKELARKIREQKTINKLKSRIKKQSTKPKMARITTPFNRSRNFVTFRNEMEKLGVIVNGSIKKKSKMFMKRRSNKNSIENNRSNEEEVKKNNTKKSRLRYDMKRKKTVSESDRFIGTKKPKHLYCGKRGVGKTDRR